MWGIHRDRWIPRTKGQLRKCFHLMTSSCWCKNACLYVFYHKLFLFVCHIYEIYYECSTFQWKYKFLVNNDLLHTRSDTIMLPIESNGRDIICMARCRFSAVDFLQNPCFGHPIAHSCGPAIGCVLWDKVKTLIYVLLQSLQYCMQYRIILDRVVAAPVLMHFNV